MLAVFDGLDVAEKRAHTALDVKVVLTPPCVYSISDSPYKIYRVARE
jgi:hypothetical protein